MTKSPVLRINRQRRTYDYSLSRFVTIERPLQLIRERAEFSSSLLMGKI